MKKLKLENTVWPFISRLPEGLCFFNFLFAPMLSETFISLRFAIVLLQPFNSSLTNVFSKPIVINSSSTDSTMNMHINLSPPQFTKKKKFSSNYTSKSAIIITLYIICIFQLIFKCCIGFCMQMYNIFRIKYITVKSISIQPLPCLSLISCVPW